MNFNFRTNKHHFYLLRNVQTTLIAYFNEHQAAKITFTLVFTLFRVFRH